MIIHTLADTDNRFSVEVFLIFYRSKIIRINKIIIKFIANTDIGKKKPLLMIDALLLGFYPVYIPSW